MALTARIIPCLDVRGGRVVKGINFKNIIDYNFTADVENNFDLIASGKKQWKEIINEFYNPFNDRVSEVEKNAKRETGERILTLYPCFCTIGFFLNSSTIDMYLSIEQFSLIVNEILSNTSAFEIFGVKNNTKMRNLIISYSF